MAGVWYNGQANAATGRGAATRGCQTRPCVAATAQMVDASSLASVAAGFALLAADFPSAPGLGHSRLLSGVKRGSVASLPRLVQRPRSKPPPPPSPSPSPNHLARPLLP